MLYKISAEFNTENPILFSILRDFLKSQKVNMKLRMELVEDNENVPEIFTKV